MQQEINPELLRRVVVPSQKSIWLNADIHGWHNPSADLNTDLLLIHSEVSEACEALRKDDMKSFAEELADVVIRVFHVAEKNGIDIAEEIWAKHNKNLYRPMRHGDKKF